MVFMLAHASMRVPSTLKCSLLTHACVIASSTTTLKKTAAVLCYSRRGAFLAKLLAWKQATGSSVLMSSNRWKCMTYWSRSQNWRSLLTV